VPLPLLRLLIQLCRSFREVFLIHDIVAVEHRPCLPATNLHNRFFVHTKAPQVPTASSPQIVYQEADVMDVATAALTIVFRHSSITGTTRNPAEPNIAAHLVPSFPKIANALAVFPCEHPVIRSLALDAHRDYCVDFPRHLDDPGIFVLCRTRIEIDGLVQEVNLPNTKIV
jgi:hypothetical protein